MQKPTSSKSDSATELSADVRLEISREVESRLKNLPAETLKFIQTEVDERMAKTEKHYKEMAALLAFCFVVVCAGFFGVTWNSVSAKVSALITDTQVKAKIAEIEKAHRFALEESVALTAIFAEFSKSEMALRARISDLERADNLITYDDSGYVTLAPRNAGIKLMQRGHPDTYVILSINSANGDFLTEQSHKGQTRLTKTLGW